MKSKKQALQVALYGMDGRAYKMMTMYLKGPCKGIAVVVDELDAEIDIIDADFIKAKDILEDRRSKTPERPIILLSLQPLSIEGTVFVKKPVNTENLTLALKQVCSGVDIDNEQSNKDKVISDVAVEPKQEGKVKELVESKKTVDKKKIEIKDKKKVSKHRTAIDLTDDVFPSYIGHIDGIDFSDIEQVLLASFNSKSYFLSYLQSALKVAKDKKQILQLNSGWKPLIIFPDNNEIWLDSEDMQLRAFSGIVMKRSSGSGMRLSAVDINKVGCNEKMECFYDIETFLWKVAIWTSKGRFPDSIDIHRPVYLKQWPNFTRLLITPHALQITALLATEPRLLMDVVNTLKIKPEYVFVFISAANTLGIVGQVKRKSDEIIAPSEMKQPKTKGLLGRILSKLRN